MNDLTRDIGDGYTRIRLSAQSGLVANAWVLQDHGSAVLFDTGFPGTTDQLLAGLAALDLTLDDLDAIVYTHTHIDHIGGGAALNAKIHCPQLFWKGTHPRLYNDLYNVLESFPIVGDWIEEFLPKTEENADCADKIRSIPENPIRCGGDGHLDHVQLVDFGEERTLCGRRFRCIEARGHDIYHSAWHDLDTGTLVSGDVILRVPTPLLPPMYDNLLQWLDTLRQWEHNPDITRLLPGHGMATTLIGPAIARSRLVLQRFLEATETCLADGLPVDPMTIIETYSGKDRSRYAQRFTVAVATLGSLLFELEHYGYLRRLETGYWVEVRTLPTWETIESWPVRHDESPGF